MKRCLFGFLLLCTITTHAQIPPITSGYGANGSFTATEARFPSPRFPDKDVFVYLPKSGANTNAPAPVIFFAPGFSIQEPDTYFPLIQHLTSRGYAVVFSPFQILLFDLAEQKTRYDTIWAGFDEAVKRYGASFDLTRVGFIGHSFGGGASFAMLQRGAVGKGWGSNGLLLFAMAPWYVYEITARQLLEFPPHAKVIVQVYEDDTICDHRIAKEVFERVNLPASEKDFVLLRSDAYEGHQLEASHGTPSGTAANGLDYYGIWRLLDALADAAFNNNANGKAVALGNGSTSQRFMGEWPSANGKPSRAVKAALTGDCVALSRASGFLFNYDQTINTLANVSAASYQSSVAAPSIASAFGKDLSTSSVTNQTTVKIRDSTCVERLAPLFFVSPAQVNYLIPPETAPGTATVMVSTSLPASNGPASQNGAAFSLGTLNVMPLAPGLFSANGNGQGVAAALALGIKPDGMLNYESISRYDEATRRYVSAPINLSNGEVFLILFGTGWRNRASLSEVFVNVGGLTPEVMYAGAQGTFSGLDQINVRLPVALAGRGEVDLYVSIGNVVSNTVKVRLQ